MGGEKPTDLGLEGKRGIGEKGERSNPIKKGKRTYRRGGETAQGKKKMEVK